MEIRRSNGLIELWFKPYYYCYCKDSDKTKIICSLDMVHDSISSTTQLIHLRTMLSAFLIKELLKKYQRIEICETKIQMVEFYLENDCELINGTILFDTSYFDNKMENTREQWEYIQKFTTNTLKTVNGDCFRIAITKEYNCDKYIKEFQYSQMNINKLIDIYLAENKIGDVIKLLKRGPIITSEKLTEIETKIMNDEQMRELEIYKKLYKIPIQ